MNKGKPKLTKSYNEQDTIHFLEACRLTEHTPMFWQAIGESEDNKGVVKHWWGSYLETKDELRHYNKSGYGIFVCVNELPAGSNRETANVIRPRAIWHDWDTPELAFPDFPLAPTLVVETSPGKRHSYWASSGDLTNDVFTELMAVMVDEYGSDPQCKDLARLMRVPGFFHWKGASLARQSREPFLSRCILAGATESSTFGTGYSEQELKDAFLKGLPRGKRRKPEVGSSRSNSNREDTLAGDTGDDKDALRSRIESALTHCPTDVGRDVWIKYGMALYDEFSGSEVGLEIWRGWSQRSPHYNERGLKKQWNSFSRRVSRENLIRGRATVASIFSDAIENGWIDHSPSFVTSNHRQLLFDEQNSPNWFNADKAFGPVQHGSITESAQQAMREFFSSVGHNPSSEHWIGLGAILRTVEAIVQGQVSTGFYMSSLPPGMGKTTSIKFAVSEMLNRHPDKGIILFVSRKAEIESYVKTLRIEQRQFACVTSDDAINSLSSTPANEAQVLFTTQQKLESMHVSRSCNFADTEEYWYQGKPRELRIWDETIGPTKSLCIDRDDLEALPQDLKRSDFKLAADVREWVDLIKDCSDGDVIEVPDFGINLTEFVERVQNSSNKDTIIKLFKLTGRSCRIRKDGGSVTAIQYEEALPDDLSPLLILDASGGLRHTYELWQKHRGNVERLYSPAKTFEGLTVHHWDRGVGREKMSSHEEVSAISQEIVATLNRIPEEDGHILIIHRKPKWTNSPDLEKYVRSFLKPEQHSRVWFITWGNHRATNEFVNCKHVFVVGLLEYIMAQYEALGRGAMDAGVEGDFEQVDLEAIRSGEIADNLYQATCRTAIRRAQGSSCPPDCHLWIIYSSRTVSSSFLSQVFRGCKVRPWSGPKPKGNTLKVNDAIIDLCTGVSNGVTKQLTTAEIARVSGVRQGDINRHIRNEALKPSLAAVGLFMEPVRGGCTVQKGVPL